MLCKRVQRPRWGLEDHAWDQGSSPLALAPAASIAAISSSSSLTSTALMYPCSLSNREELVMGMILIQRQYIKLKTSGRPHPFVAPQARST